MMKNIDKSALLSIGASMTALLLFFELISVFNNQWRIDPLMSIYPFDFLMDMDEGMWIETLSSTLLTLVIYALFYCWYQGGLSRIIVNYMTLGASALLLAVVFTTLVFNGWMQIHITTCAQWIEVLSSMGHGQIAYSRFWLSLLLGCLLPIGFVIHYVYDYLRQDNKVLGNAHFAGGIETWKTGFFHHNDESIIIGKKYGQPLYSNGFEHVLVFAPIGTGKTRSIAIPNLFHFPYSVVCNDVKLTLFKTTSGYREKKLGHQCFCWAPSNSEGITHRFNPLYYISIDKLQRMTDIQRIAHILIPDCKKVASIWTQSSRKLFKALVLYLLDTPERPTTFGELNRLVKQQHFDTWLLELLETTDHYDPEFYRNGFSYINAHEETRTSILISFSGYLELFDDPIVDAATSANDFDIRALRKQKMTIYVGFTDEDMERLAPILTLFWQQVISAMIKEIPCPKEEPYPLLCLIDEFSSLGRIDRLRRSLKLLREYRVRCILMFQYIAQTYEQYSHDEAKAFTNIKTKIAYGNEDLSDAEFISKLLGTRTKKVVARSVSSHANGGINESKNVSYQAIPLLRPDEVTRLKSDIALIIRSGSSPIKAKQYIWYKESLMKSLEEKASVIPKQVIKQSLFVRDPKVKTKQAVIEEESEAFSDEEMLDWVEE